MDVQAILSVINISFAVAAGVLVVVVTWSGLTSRHWLGKKGLDKEI